MQLFYINDAKRVVGKNYCSEHKMKHLLNARLGLIYFRQLIPDTGKLLLVNASAN